MLVVLAYRYDAAARALVQRWRAAGEQAALLTCADLARPGWRYVAGNPAAGFADIDGQVIATPRIRAVITRMPAVGEAELAHVHEDDRATPRPKCRRSCWRGSAHSNARCSIVRLHPTWEARGGASPSGFSGRGGLAWQRGRSAPRRVRRRTLRLATNAAWTRTSIFVDVVGDRAFLAGGREPGDERGPAGARRRLAGSRRRS